MPKQLASLETIEQQYHANTENGNASNSGIVLGQIPNLETQRQRIWKLAPSAQQTWKYQLHLLEPWLTWEPKQGNNTGCTSA